MSAVGDKVKPIVKKHRKVVDRMEPGSTDGVVSKNKSRKAKGSQATGLREGVTGGERITKRRSAGDRKPKAIKVEAESVMGKATVQNHDSGAGTGSTGNVVLPKRKDRRPKADSSVQSKEGKRRVDQDRINRLAEPRRGRPSVSPVVRSGGKKATKPGEQPIVIRRSELGASNLIVGSARRQLLEGASPCGRHTELNYGTDDNEPLPLVERLKKRGVGNTHGKSGQELEAAVVLTKLSSDGGKGDGRKTKSRRTVSAAAVRSAELDQVPHDHGSTVVVPSTSGQGDSSSGKRRTTERPMPRLLPKRPRMGEGCASTPSTAGRSGDAGLSIGSIRQSQVGYSSYPRSAFSGRPVQRFGGADNQRTVDGHSSSLTMSVKEVKALKQDQPIVKTVTVVVLRLQEPMERNSLVHKNRRKAVIADRTGFMVAYIKKSLPVKFSEGHCLLLSNFRANQGVVTIHDKSLITRTQGVNLPTEVAEAGILLFDSPQNAPSSIPNIVGRGPGTLCTIIARVIQTEDSRLVTDREKRQKLVKEITLQQHSSTIKMSLWDAAAAYTVFNVGDTIEARDVSSVWSSHHRAAALTCNFSDQIKVLPAALQEEEIIILGLEESMVFDELECTVEANHSIVLYSVHRYQLMRQLNIPDELTVDELLRYLPITAVAVVEGQRITQLEVHSHSGGVAFRNSENDEPFRPIQPESAEDIFEDGYPLLAGRSSRQAAEQYSDEEAGADGHYSSGESTGASGLSCSSTSNGEEPMDCSGESSIAITSDEEDQLLFSDKDEAGSGGHKGSAVGPVDIESVVGGRGNDQGDALGSASGSTGDTVTGLAATSGETVIVRSELVFQGTSGTDEQVSLTIGEGSEYSSGVIADTSRSTNAGEGTLVQTDDSTL